MRPEDLLSLWKGMANENGTGSSLIRRRIAPDAMTDLFASYIPSKRAPGMIIEVGAEISTVKNDLPECRGITFDSEVTGPADERRTIFRIHLESPAQHEVFAILCADLLGIMVSVLDPVAALEQGVRRLGAWQALFERVKKEGLSPEKQRGLFGELQILRSLLLPERHPLDAVFSWLGWEPANQDFKLGGLAIECKTTMAKRHAKAIISNEKQLDETPHELLVLAFVRLDESEAFGLSLPSQVKILRSELETEAVALLELDMRLLQAGYLECQASLYASPSYQVSSIQYFKIQDEFPRLTEANLPHGVGDIKYSIIPGDLDKFAIGDEEMRQIVRAGT
jgi:hypothetical protein